MSEKFAHFCLKHKILGAAVQFFFYVLLLSGFCYIFDWSWAVWAIAAAVLLYFSILSVNLVVLRITLPAFKKLNDECDPYPLLAASNEILKHATADSDRVVATINRCVALTYLGEDEKSFDELSGLDIESRKRIIPQNKLVYYNNLASAYIVSGDVATAKKWHEKSREFISEIKNKKNRAHYEDTLNYTFAELLIAEGEYEKAKKLLASVDSTTKMRSVTLAMASAKINIGLGRIDRAKTDLEYVIATGNKLCCVTEAEEMLAKLPQ